MIPQGAKDDALRHLATRMRSEQEMRRHLKKCGWHEVADAVIAWLYEYEYLDDAAFAGSYIRDKLRFHPCGRRKLQVELRKKGIADAHIAAALAANFPLALEQRLAEHFFSRQAAKGRNTAQILRYLYHKGFSGETMSVIEERHWE